MECNIVSAEKEIFSGTIKSLILSGTEGELGIFPGHAPLLSALKPGPVILITEADERLVFYLSGGFLEIQPKSVSVLADTAYHPKEISEDAARRAMERAQSEMKDQKGEFDYSKAATELARISAQLRTLEEIRKTAKR